MFSTQTKGRSSKITHHVASDIIQELIREHISDFRSYIPLMLRIYSGLTDSFKACYLGCTPGRLSQDADRNVLPTIFLKAIIDNDVFRWGAGEIYEISNTLPYTAQPASSLSVDTDIHAGFRHVCSEEKESASALVIPLFLGQNGKPPPYPKGFIVLFKKTQIYSDLDVKLAEKVTSFFVSHLRNFELLRKDQLTNFYNQRQKTDLFTTEIKRAIENDYCLGLMLIDIDHFKYFNDQYGHLNGDCLLSQFGGLILNHIRPYDRPVRVGGEEFLIMTPKVDCKRLQSLADRLRRLIKDHKFMDRHGTPSFRGITASFGVLLLENLEERVADTEYYFELTDRNLYEAKRKGRNRIEFTRY